MRCLGSAAVVVALVLAHASSACANIIDPDRVAADIVDSFRATQMADGNVADPVAGAGPARRYSQAMFAYAGLRLAARTDDDARRAFALRSLDYVAARPESHRASPSVFEIGAAAAAYNALGDTSTEPARARIAGWLAGARAVFVSDTGHYRDNKYVVEAHALLELCRAGPAVRADGAALCERGARLLTRGLRTAAMSASGASLRGRSFVVLSDPPANPPAYHQLVLGYLARSMTLIESPSPSMRDLLVRFARGTEALAAPDGDVAYWGRSQEQGWSLVLGAYGLREAARFAQPAEAARFAALADRLLTRFREHHVGGPYGTYLTPAYRGDPTHRPAGVDGYSYAATYAALTAMGLMWLADQPAASASATVAAASDAFVLPASATVLRGSTWMAVRRRHAPGEDLRSDFGLVAAKARVDGRWRDLLQLRPRTAAGTDSAEPILRVRGAVGYPDGATVRVRPDGTVVVRGGWRTTAGAWLRRTTFRFAPTARGVRLTVPVRRADRVELSVFATAPRVAGRAVVDGWRRVTTSIPMRARVQGGYASGSERALSRVRLSARVARAGRLVVVFGYQRMGTS